jgi:hypothetical protein
LPATTLTDAPLPPPSPWRFSLAFLQLQTTFHSLPLLKSASSNHQFKSSSHHHHNHSKIKTRTLLHTSPIQHHGITF